MKKKLVVLLIFNFSSFACQHGELVHGDINFSYRVETEFEHALIFDDFNQAKEFVDKYPSFITVKHLHSTCGMIYSMHRGWTILELLVDNYTQIGTIAYIDTMQVGHPLTFLFDYYAANPQLFAQLILKLVRKGETIECVNWYGYTPLMLAVEYDNLSLVKIIVEKGATKERIYYSGKNVMCRCTALDLAMKLDTTDIEKYLQIYSMAYNAKAVKTNFKNFNQYQDCTLSYGH